MITLLLAVGISTVVSLVGTKLLILWLTRRAIGQPIHEDVPEGHLVKAGTPTMGGVAIVVGAMAGYVGSNLYYGVFTWTGIAVILAIGGAGVVGFLDDWIKIANERNLGLGKGAKLGLIKGDQANVESFVTQKALDGLFLMMAEEEKAIRADPVGKGTDIVKKVFGALGK